MSYRRPADPGHPYCSHFRIKHRSELIACGVPDEIADSDRRWMYVIVHGADPSGATGWSTSWISVTQAQTLLNLMRSYGWEPGGCDLMYDLQQRLEVESRR